MTLNAPKFFNNFFNGVINELTILIDPSLLEDVSGIKDPILVDLQKYKRHPSMHKIKEMIRKSTSSHQRCSVRKGALTNFAKFTGKHLCQSFLFNKVQVGLQLYLKRNSGTGVFL